MAPIGTPWKECIYIYIQIKYVHIYIYTLTVIIHMYHQVIQAVTFAYPNVGGHQQPSKGARVHHPKLWSQRLVKYII